MDQFTHDVRTANWVKTICKCYECSENQTAKEFLDENGSKKSSIIMGNVRIKSRYEWENVLGSAKNYTEYSVSDKKVDIPSD